jgi:hypothetical protein
VENQTLFREILSVAEMVRKAAFSGDHWGGMARARGARCPRKFA